MKILQFFEWCAAAVIIAAIVLGLGKVAVDQIVYITRFPQPATLVARPLSTEEIQLYLADLRKRDDESSREAVVVVEAKLRGER